jgi:Transcriptional regulator
LSRQIKDFEETLGTPLFDRNKKMELTAAGLLLKDSAQEIFELVNKATDEFDSQRKELFSGKISFGCIEGSGSDIFSELVATSYEKYPHVTYNVFTGTGDDISDRIDQGNIDFGILLEPIHLYKYNSIRFNNPES